ncbi:L,D-transpeptidase family protein [Sphingomonas sp. AP4-R1]|uniref:L,D-transpeptidase family protein n=1 Tax=Sphingomonas sp. AP4-R1 TaxID=2735134 RepID=UPI001493BC1D|nr:L,D-transpeptidase family protein [Sphingomonas sp. AP4-R1]QJU57886.1 L,D-transpeptidase family protein [Sphingomonas sp. AP4-R1]
MQFKRRPAPADWRLLLLSGAAFCAVGAGSVPDQPVTATAAALDAPAPAAAAVWKKSAVRDLIGAIEASADEGLRPEDYGLAALKGGLDAGESPALDALAERSALTLAHDYQYGRVGDRADLGWHIDRGQGSVDPMVLNGAVLRGQVRSYLESLLPIDARYKALKTALADAPDGASRDRIRANMERWRWMPRDLGRDYLYVNVPSYRLQRIEDGTVLSTYTVVVGAKDTPTPWIAGDAPSLVVNPWWNVPQSIIKSSNLRPGRGGYVFKASAGGYTVRQPPGPRNALGRLKINLTNDQAIYLHDTPAKAGFAKDDRALSHGCIRVKNIDQLAAELMSDGGDGTQLDEALAQADTRTLQLPKRTNVYLVYFTLDQDEKGDLVSYGDPYGRDAQVIARLDGRPVRDTRAPLQVASN